MTHEHVGVSFRDHPLRFFQSAFQSLTPQIVEFMRQKGWLDKTPVATALNQGETLQPDHLTLAGLQITIEAARALANGDSYKPIGRMILGGVLDVLDGSLARHLNLSSPEGAVKDVLADRIAEIYIAQLIADTNLPDLKIAFQLSTLTKAASEMVGVHTSEGGPGSMLERRRILLCTLQKLGKLKSATNLNYSSRDKISSEINNNIILLIKSSKQRAKERIEQIKTSGLFVQREWNNPALDDETSPAAIEARKYTAVVLMNQREGLDIVSHLNELAGYEMFPSLESFTRNDKYKYVAECLNNTRQFLEDALSLIHRG